MDSLVCWYDPGKQQCTNESMAANPVLADLSGNGHDIKCFNFGWAGMSGIGCYTNFNVDTSRANIEILGEQHWLINSINQDNTINRECILCRKQDFATFFCGKTIQVKLTGNVLSESYFRINSSRTYLKEGVNEITIPAIDSEDFINGPYLIFTFPLETVNVELEILPLYPNALVSDGVDDYCYTDGLPILTDYTVIAKRKILADKVSALASKATDNNSTDGAFIFDAKNVAGYIACNFGANNALVELYPEDVSYQTKESYNGSPIIKLNHADTDKLSLFTFSAQNNLVSQYALYSFLLFDRTLTTAEIEWVKKNMIESGGVLKTDWMQEPWKRLDTNRITGTGSSNVLKITSCKQTQNFKESGQNAYIPSFKIKVTGLKNGIRLIYINTSIVKFRIEEDGIYTLEEQEGDWIGFRFDKTFENENIVIQQLLS